MLLILIGYLLIALDVLVGIGGLVWELPPDFLGYLLIAIGAGKLALENPGFALAKSFSFVAAGVSGFLFMLRLLSLSYAATSILIIMEVAELVFMIIIVRLLISGLGKMEKQTGLSLQYKVLKYLWIGLIVAIVAAYLGQIFPTVNGITSLVLDVVSLGMFAFFYFAYQTIKEAK